jgi:hypothetical protein
MIYLFGRFPIDAIAVALKYHYMFQKILIQKNVLFFFKENLIFNFLIYSIVFNLQNIFIHQIQ